MNIGFIANVPYHSVGGRLQRFAYEIKKKHPLFWIDPPVVSSYDSKKINPDIDTKNITILSTPSTSNVFFKTILKEWYSYKYVRKLKELDVCVVYDGWGSFFARRYLKKKNIPVVFDYVDQMYHFSKNDFMKKVHRWLIRDAFKLSDAVVCTAYKLVEEAQEDSSNVIYIPNGAPEIAKKVKPTVTSKKTIVGYLGAFGEWVDFSLLDEAIDHLSDVEFYLIGGGAQTDHVKELADKHENVTYVPPVPYKDVHSWIQSFDIAIIPFAINDITHAVSPLKLFEYWSLKKPVICTPTYELLKSTKNELVFAKNSTQFYNAIKELSKDKKKITQLGTAGYDLFKKEHTFKKLTKEFVKVLENECKKKAA